MFVDRVAVFARGGAGGAGIASFIRRKGKPRGKPDGGNGGAGGDVIVRADSSVNTLLEFSRRPHRRAGDGTHGEGALRHGRRGEDLMVGVPLGTVVLLADGTMLADLVQEDQSVTVAQGGRGGLGNAGLVNRNLKAPGFAEQGEYGQEREVIFELKLMADAALIGFPNAGKSTIIAAVSASRPKIADYPFTTLVPNLGVVDAGESQFVLADVPGLIEGAAEGKGLGHEFLRHTERARLLIYVLDPSPLQTEGVIAQFEILQRELRDHADDLSDRPSIVVLNKSDLEESKEAARRLEEAGVGYLAVSGATGDGLEQMVGEVARRLAQLPAKQQEVEGAGYMLHRPVETDLVISPTADGWLVEGRAAERAVAFNDLTIPLAADLAAARLRRSGVEAALVDAGAKPGDEVVIGDIVFEFQPEDEE